MALDQALIQEIKDRADIVDVISSYLKVERRGKQVLAVCPFHDDTNPSLSISQEKQIFKCFVCGTSGNVFTFVSKYTHCSFQEAVKKVAEIINFQDPRLEEHTYVKQVDPRKTLMLKCLKDLTTYYQYSLNTEEGVDGLNYLQERHLDNECRTKYLLGYAPKDGKATIRFLEKKGHSLKTIEDVGIGSLSNGAYHDRNQGRVIFPICDKEGNVVGFSARRIKQSDEAKYVNTPDTYLFHKGNILYNYHIAKDKAKNVGYLYICEGFMDIFALAKIGIDAAVAIMGTSLTEEHISLLRLLNVELRLCLDGDLPGQTAMMGIASSLEKAGLHFRIVDNRNSTKDPDEILNQEGSNALNAYLNNLISRVDFALNYYRNSNPLKTNEQKKKLIKEFLPILLNTKSQLELDSYLRKLATITGYEAESIRSLLDRSRDTAIYKDPRDAIVEFHPEKKILNRLKLAEKALLYQMISNLEAVEFYEKEVGNFYDPVYRKVAEFIISYAQENKNINPNDLVCSLEQSDISNKEELEKEIFDLYAEINYPKDCNKDLLVNLVDSINQEKVKIYEKDVLASSLEGKTPLERARIMAEYNRRKMKNKK